MNWLPWSIAYVEGAGLQYRSGHVIVRDNLWGIFGGNMTYLKEFIHLESFTYFYNMVVITHPTPPLPSPFRTLLQLAARFAPRIHAAVAAYAAAGD